MTVTAPGSAYKESTETDWKAWILSDKRLVFNETHPFDRDDQRSNTSAEVARQVTSVLSAFFEPEFHTEEVQSSLAGRETFVCGPEELSKAGITPKQREQFNRLLAQQIETFLGKGGHGTLVFTADYHPKGKLEECVNESGIKYPRYTPIFPLKSVVKITGLKKPGNSWAPDIGSIRVSVDLTAPLPLTEGALVLSMLDPKQPSQFNRLSFFETPAERREALEMASKEAAELLTLFLTEKLYTPEAQALLKAKGTRTPVRDLETFREHGITPEKCSTFQSCVSTQIVTQITSELEKGYLNPSTRHATHGTAEGNLLAALKKAQIKPHKGTYLFPLESSVSVWFRGLDDGKGEVEIEVNFKG